MSTEYSELLLSGEREKAVSSLEVKVLFPGCDSSQQLAAEIWAARDLFLDEAVYINIKPHCTNVNCSFFLSWNGGEYNGSTSNDFALSDY